MNGSIETRHYPRPHRPAQVVFPDGEGSSQFAQRREQPVNFLSRVVMYEADSEHPATGFHAQTFAEV